MHIRYINKFIRLFVKFRMLMLAPFEILVHKNCRLYSGVLVYSLRVHCTVQYVTKKILVLKKIECAYYDCTFALYEQASGSMRVAPAIRYM